MYPTHPIRPDLETGIRGAVDHGVLKEGVLRALESLIYDVSDHAARIDTKSARIEELERRVEAQNVR